MLKKIALTLFLLVTLTVAVILAIAATRPATFHVERSTTTSASPQTVYMLVNDLHRFCEWSPWQKLDPAMKTRFEGSQVGVGSSYSWIGNDQVGEGRMTITEVMPANHVAMKLEFLKPWKSTNEVHFRIEPSGDGSRVTWAMDGTNDYLAKVMTLFMNMDNVIGKDFEDGLASLKVLSERPAPAPSSRAADSAATDASATGRP